MKKLEIEITSTPINNWDKHVKHPLQTTMYAMYNYEHNGAIPHYCYIKKNGRNEGQLLYFIKGKGAEFFINFPLGKTIGKISKKFFPIISFEQGPTFYEEYNRTYTIEDIIEEIKKHHNINTIQATTPTPNTNNWATYKINLNHNTPTLWKRIKKPARKNINKAKKETTTIINNKTTTIKQYLNLLKQSRKELGLKHLPPCYPNQTLKKHFNSHCQIILIQHKKEPLAAMGIIEHNGYILEIGNAISPKCRELNIYAGDLIKWEIIQHGKNKKHHTYDLGGCNPKPIDKKEESIKKFKKKFGGKYQEYGIIK